MGQRILDIVVTAHNMEDYLQACLTSISEQTFTDFNVVIVEDGSTDATLSIAEDFASRDNRFRVVHTEICNAGGARNYGMGLVGSTYFMLLDGDDIFRPDMLEKLYRSISRYDADIAVCDYTQFENATHREIAAPWALRTSQLPGQECFSWRDVPGNIFAAFTGCPWNKLYRTAFVREAGLCFPEDMSNCEDTPFVYPALILAHRIVVVDEVLIDRRVARSTSVEASRANEPSALYECICRVKSFLKSQPGNVWKLLQQDYLNWAFDLTLWNIETMPDAVVRQDLVKKLSENEFIELELAEQEPVYFALYPRSMARYATILSECPNPDEGPLGSLKELPYGRFKPWCQSSIFDKVAIKWRMRRCKPVEW